MTKITKKSENGFTLIEVLLISVIVLLIGVSVTMLFTGGRKTWTSADKGSETIQNAVIGMEKVVREIKNSPGLTDFDEANISEEFPEIRFAVLRNDGSGNYVTKYAKVKREGNYLKYGEMDTDSDTDSDWTLNDLAYPVTKLEFSFKKLDGNDANPGTDDPTDIKSVLIKMITSEDGTEIPLNSRANIATNIAMNFDGTPEDEGEGHHFNEGNEETSSPPPSGSKGDGVEGWGLTDYVIYGDREVAIANLSTINGNVGTRSLAETTSGPYLGVNNSTINGYLVVKDSFRMENHSTINDSVLAACGTKSSSSEFANNCQINGNFWTLHNVTMDNSSWIEGTVYKPTSATITDAKCKAIYNMTAEEIAAGKYNFMLDPAVAAGKSVFPSMPSREENGFAGSTPDVIIKKNNKTIGPAAYDEISVTNATLTMTSGIYHINSFIMSNSSRVIFNFTNGPIWIYVKTSFAVGNSASFGYCDNGVDKSADPKFGADLLYIEPRTGMTCQNSVRGFIYAPEGDITFSTGGTTLYGAAYSGKKVNIEQRFTATYVPPAFDYVLKKPILLSMKLLDGSYKFYPQLAP